MAHPQGCGARRPSTAPGTVRHRPQLEVVSWRRYTSSGERRDWRSEVPKVQVGANVLPVLGIVLLVLPAYFIARWIRIVNEVSGHDDRVAEFGSILPGVLQGPLASTLFALACAATAAAVGAAGLTRLTGLRRQLSALLHESSRARTMPPDTILTCRCDMTRVGRGRSSDSGSHSRGRPHSPAQLDSGREGHRR